MGPCNFQDGGDVNDSNTGGLEKVGLDSTSVTVRLQGSLGRNEGWVKGRLVPVLASAPTRPAVYPLQSSVYSSSLLRHYVTVSDHTFRS